MNIGLPRDFISGAMQVEEGLHGARTPKGKGDQDTSYTEVDNVDSPCPGRDVNTQYGLARRLDYCVLSRTIRLPRRTSRAGDNDDGPDTVDKDSPDGAAVRSTILQGPPYGACAMTGRALSTNSLGPSTLPVELISLLCMASAVTHQLSCHVLPQRLKPPRRSWQSPPRTEN